MSFDISKLNQKVDLSGGEWQGDIEDNPGVRLKVRSSRYRPYRNAVERLSRKAGKGGLSAVVLGEVMAEHLLLDWDFSEGDGPIVLVQNGSPVSYSADIAKAVLTADDDHGVGAQFRDAVYLAAVAVAERLASEAKESAGN